MTGVRMTATVTAKSGDDNTAVERIGRDSHRRINNREVCPGSMKQDQKDLNLLDRARQEEPAPDFFFQKKRGKKREKPRGKAPQQFEQRAARRA